MSFLKSYFGLGATPAPVSVPDTDKSKPQNATTQSTGIRALPGSWYVSQEMYDLEKRAIFSKKWLLTTHNLRLPNKGDWQRYQVTEFHYVVCRDQNDKIKAFHIDQDLKEFDIEKHGVFSIHVQIDKKGFVWVNLDGGEKPEISWNEDLEGCDDQERFDYYDWDCYEYDHTWEMEGEYNWKLLGDNYNECYHCRVSHPDLRDLTDINTYVVTPVKSYLMHFGSPTPEMVARGFKIAPTYYFPNASVNVSRNFFMMQRFIPTSPRTSIMRYEVYRNKYATDEAFHEIDSLYKRVMSEDKFLALGAQRNIERGVFINGEMHPGMEKGAIWFQTNVRDQVQEHFNREVEAGRQIWPAQISMSKIAAQAEENVPIAPLEAGPESIAI